MRKESHSYLRKAIAKYYIFMCFAEGRVERLEKYQLGALTTIESGGKSYHCKVFTATKLK
jgi:hypothetical protein